MCTSGMQPKTLASCLDHCHRHVAAIVAQIRLARHCIAPAFLKCCTGVCAHRARACLLLDVCARAWPSCAWRVRFLTCGVLRWAGTVRSARRCRPAGPTEDSGPAGPTEGSDRAAGRVPSSCPASSHHFAVEKVCEAVVPPGRVGCRAH